MYTGNQKLKLKFYGCNHSAKISFRTELQWSNLIECNYN